MRSRLFVLVAFCVAGCDKSTSSGGSDTKADIEVDFGVLMSAYRSNSVAADDKYRGKRLLVRGVPIERVGKTGGGKPVISSMNREDGRAVFHFRSAGDPSAAGASTRMTDIAGTCAGKSVDSPAGGDDVSVADWFVVFDSAKVIGNWVPPSERKDGKVPELPPGGGKFRAPPPK